MPELRFDALSIEEKLRAMEALWDALIQDAESVVSPPWHGALLAEREAAVARGDEVPMDWEEAKRKLRADLE